MRTGSSPYNLTYDYDDGGNRTKKTKTTTNRETIYVYDLSDSVLNGSKNNRLMKAEEYDTAQNPDELLNTTWYLYNCAGNVERVVKHDESTTTFTATRMVYARNDRTVTFIADESWEPDRPDALSEMDNYAVTALREYRYDSGRARYMARKYHAGRVMANMTTGAQWSTADPELLNERVVEIFTDYEGDQPYGDFIETDFTSVPPDNTFSYEPGIWRKDLVAGTSEYLHSGGVAWPSAAS